MLCIRGKWGVGKTFAWNEQLQRCQALGAICAPRYSYVSLFGINSLDELKFSIFENVVPTEKGAPLKADLQSLDALFNSKVGPWRRVARFAQNLPILNSFVGREATALLSFLTVRDQLICFDDIERTGVKLDLGDILGLISLLREQRGCKVVLLLNDQALEPGAREKFDRYLEKVVNISLVYQPTAVEAATVAIPDKDDLSLYVVDRCVVLGVSNIRVIKRIDFLVKQLHAALASCDPEAVRAAASSLALIAWAIYQPDEAPSLDFLMRRRFSDVVKETEAGPQEIAWSALVIRYGFARWTPLETTLAEAVRNGFFDADQLAPHATTLQERLRAERADLTFEAAWNRYHDSFADDQQAVLHGIYEAFAKGFHHITKLDLNNTVELFKELGHAAEARQMIELFVNERRDEDAFFDIQADPLLAGQADADVARGLALRLAGSDRPKRDLSELLDRLSDEISVEIVDEIIQSCPTEDFRALFKNAHGEDLRAKLDTALQFGRMEKASEKMRLISNRAREALRLIAGESPINALRVRKFGITVNDHESGSV